jgi:hypothetical protein
MTEANFSGQGLGVPGAIILAAWLSLDKCAPSMLSLKTNNLRADGGKALAEGLKGNTVITALDISSNALGAGSDCEPDMSGVIALAYAVPDMGAISSVNLLKNSIGTDQVKTLVNMLNDHPTLKSLCGNQGDETELDMSGKMSGAEDAMMLAAEIIGNGALLSLNISSSGLCIEGTKLLAKALESNQTMTSLNVSSNARSIKNGEQDDDISGVAALADGIPSMGALTKFDISSNGIRAEGGKALAAGIKGNQVIAELNISYNDMGYNFDADVDTSGIIAIADVISDMGALSMLNFAANLLGELVMPEGWSKGSGKHDEHGYGWYTQTNGKDQKEHPGKPEGIIALANAIPNMGALTSLDISNNRVGGRTWTGIGTPEGSCCLQTMPHLICLLNIGRPKSHCWCHPRQQGVDVAEYVCQ